MAREEVRAELKRLHSPDALNLKDFRPQSYFGILIQAMIGPAGAEGEESFDFIFCTPEWFADHMRKDIVPGRHHVFAKQYDYSTLECFVRGVCASCHGESWSAVAEQLGRIGKWEFEDYEE
jgi:hypothetical protein